MQLAVTSVQQIFGVQVALYELQHNKVYKIKVFYTKMFSFLFLMVSWLKCPINVLNVACGNSFSNQWAFTMLETKVFKYNFLNIYVTKTTQCILLKFVQLALNE